ncbi:alpha/beta hydrolase [Nocardia panacis]|uniref:Alpha/beta hydrolase n=1 Tax=Nocardia panacis TaxID=2340916 RepID=A0A3A4KDS3_9NOCA|nr:alpha/beta hydrolase [Nocardia panacis]RJO76861.1 alpha/beta hydrolase [Nocardia panacis]
MIEHIEIPTAAGTFDALAAGPDEGREVLLLHGFPQSGLEWEFQLTALGGGGCRAVAPHQRGYSPGVRPERMDDYRSAELVADVAAMADQLGWRRFDLVGHDWGAAVAWEFAATHPQRVRTLTAVSIPHPTAFRRALDTDPDQAQRSRYFHLLRQPRVAERALLADNAAGLRRIFEWKIPQERVEEYVTRLAEPGALTAALNWYRAMHLAGPIEKVSVPTLYVWSTEDSAVGSTAALAARDYVTGPYRFEMLEDVSHWIPEQAPEALTGHLMRHLLDHRA